MYNVAPQSGPSGREERITQMGQRTCLLVDADAVCLHRVPSGKGIGGVYHGADTLGLRVSQDTPGAYEVSAGPKERRDRRTFRTGRARALTRR